MSIRSAAFALASCLVLSGTALADTVTETIGKLPSGKTVVIRFQATVNDPLPGGVGSVSNQGSVSGSNFTTVQTDDPDVGGATDPTTTVVQLPSTTGVVSSVPASVFGQTVTFTATVSGSAGTPTGSVQFVIDSVNAGAPVPLDGSGQASLSTSSLTVGGHTVSAVYAATAQYASSTGVLGGGQTVAKANTTASITSDTPDPSVVGQPVSVGFSVSPVAPGAGTPTGSVEVSDGVTSCTGALGGGTGSCNITLTSAGAKTLTATYLGDGNFNASPASTGEPHTVNKGDVTVTITGDAPDPSIQGETVTVIFTVVAASPASGTPTGDVTVSDGVDSCMATLAGGAGMCNVALSTIGSRTLTATYVGDSSFNGGSDTEPHVVSNRPPVVNDQTLGPVAENSPNGTVVGTVVATDPDAGQTLSYAITGGNTGTAFAINATTGQVTVATSAAVDFETTPTFSLTVQVTDNGPTPESDTATVTIDLTDVNEAPVVGDQTFGPLAEHSANGTVVGTVVANDPDAGQTLGYAITAGNTGGAFAINPTTGQLTVASAASIDFETTPVFTLTVEVTDNGTPPLSDTAMVTVNLQDVNEAPVISPQTLGPINEHSPNGTVVGTVSASEVDAGQTLGYAITAGNTGGAFAINASSGQVTVANSAAVDFATTPTFGLTVEVTDDGTPPLSSSATITINLIQSSLAVSDVTVMEGDSGTTAAVFTVTLTGGGTQTITVDYQTADGSAVAPGDYGSVSGMLTFTPGGTNPQTVTVLVNGDVMHEPTETFSFQLSNAVNAALGDAMGAGTITNDDPLPGVSIDDVTVLEGTSGTTNATLTVSLTNPASETVQVNFATSDVTAMAGSDYVATSGTLSIPSGATSGTITVQVNGDLTPEAIETLHVTLSNAITSPSNVVLTISDAVGVVTIRDDDSPGDWNGDGKKDLLFRNHATGADAVWFMDGATRIGTAVLPAAADLDYRIGAIGDLNGDSRTDIVWRNQRTGANAVWLMDLTTRLGTVLLEAAPNTQWRMAGAGDFDSDGDQDLVWRNYTTGENAVWFMTGTTKTGEAGLLGVADTAWSIAAVADFDADGKPDLLWRNYVTGANAVWYMDGVVKKPAAGALPASTDLNWRIVGAMDWDLDGDPDIVWRNQATGSNAIWFMDGVNKVGAAVLPSATDLNWRIVPSDF